MYEIYQLHAEPFRLSPDPAFCYEHKGFSTGHAYLKYALTQGDGICIVTGHPGTGKTMLVEYFLRELDRSTLLTATLFNTQIEGDDLFRMVGFGFGIDIRNLDRATMLHNLQEFLRAKRLCGQRALLIVDEAQKLSTTALEQLRMLTNLKDGSQPLLQLFLVGQKQLIDVIRTTEMEPLYQRLISTADLEPLVIDETSAYIQHRLRCAGWPGGQLFSKEAVVLIHRFSAGYPRLINKICGRSLLYGSMEQKPRLGAEEIFNTLVQVQDEHLMPGNDIWGPGVAAGWQHMVNAGFKNSGWTSHLSREELAFLEQPDISPQTKTSSETISQPASAPVTAYAPEQSQSSIPQGTLASPPHQETTPFVPAVTVHRDAAAEDAVSQDLAYWQVSGKPGHHGGWKNPWVGVAMSAVLVLIVFGAITDRSANTGDGSTVALVQTTVYQGVEPAVGETQPAQPRQEPVDDQQSAMPSYESGRAAIENPLLEAPTGETAVSKPHGVSSDTQASGWERDMGVQPMDMEFEAPAVEIHSPAGGNPVAEKAKASEPAVITSVDGKVEALLALGETAYQTNHLTLPSGKSAFSYFSQVLVLDPDNEVAQQGMQRIVVRYRGMAQQALQREEFSKAQRHAARGLRIEPGNTRLLRLQETARSRENEIRAAQQRAAAPPPKIIEADDNKQVQKGFWGALKKIFTAPPSSEVSTRNFSGDEP